MAAFVGTTLGAVAEFVNGGAWNANEYCDNGVLVVRVSDIHDETIDLSECKYLPRDVFQKYERHVLATGDLIICTVGSHPTQPGSVVGRAAIVPPSCHGALLNQNAVRIRPLSAHVDRTWLGYLGRSKKFHDYIVSCARGSANQVRMAIGLLKEMPVEVPPLSVQRRIGDALAAYDALIENNKRRIRILEDMATAAIFGEWFIAIRMPGLLSGGPQYLPEGWGRKPFLHCVELNPKVVVPREGEKPFVPMGSLSNDSMIMNDIEQRTGNSGSKFQNGDTLFARITPCLENGKTGFVQFLRSAQSVAFGSTEFIVLRSKTLTPEFVYLLARTEEVKGPAIKSMLGASGRHRVQERCFDTMTVVQPPMDALARFTDTVRPMFRLVHQLHLQNLKLRAMRDLLLPRLLSGQLSLDDMEGDTSVRPEARGA